jgi:undecaprenyldiphospho-muramoylpentapeptide beta-N-acetylglucosaminyltransferase
MKVLVCAGGTGGGIYPALAAAAELQHLGLKGKELLWVGTSGEMEEELVPRAGLHLETIPGGAIVGVSPYKMIMNGLKLTSGFAKAWGLVGRFQPDVVFMTGGYMAVPVTLAAWLRRVPIAIFLPDVEPGSAIRAIMPFARRVACTTEGSREYVSSSKLVVTGYPVRPELREAAELSRQQALAQFDLRPQRRTLFVFGGSRGARSINQALIANLPDLLAQIQVIHVTGTLTWPEVEASAKELPAEQRAYYRPYPYLHEKMGAAFRSADLVLARAGASMLGECPAYGLPSILVPYPHAWRYQKVNADYLTERNAALQMADERLMDEMSSITLGLLRDDARLAHMGAAARSLDKPDAAADLAHFIMGVGHASLQGMSA